MSKIEEAKRRYIEEHVSRNEYASFGAAFVAGAEWQKKQAIEAFRQFVEDYCDESGRKDIVEDSEHYIKVFNELINP